MRPGGASGYDAHRENSVNEFSRTSTFSLGIGASPPWHSGKYVPVTITCISSNAAVCSPFHLIKQYFPYGHFGQGGINHTGSPVPTEQVSNNVMNISHPFPGTSALQGIQGATPVWQLSDLNWVNYEAEGELHLTIVFRKVPFA